MAAQSSDDEDLGAGNEVLQVKLATTMMPFVAAPAFIEYGDSMRKSPVDSHVIVKHAELIKALRRVSDDLKFKQSEVMKALDHVHGLRNFCLPPAQKIDWQKTCSARLRTMLCHVRDTMIRKPSTKWLGKLFPQAGVPVNSPRDGGVAVNSPRHEGVAASPALQADVAVDSSQQADVAVTSPRLEGVAPQTIRKRPAAAPREDSDKPTQATQMEPTNSQQGLENMSLGDMSLEELIQTATIETPSDETLTHDTEASKIVVNDDGTIHSTFGYDAERRAAWRQKGEGSLKEHTTNVVAPDGATDDDDLLAAWPDGAQHPVGGWKVKDAANLEAAAKGGLKRKRRPAHWQGTMQGSADKLEVKTKSDKLNADGSRLQIVALNLNGKQICQQSTSSIAEELAVEIMITVGKDFANNIIAKEQLYERRNELLGK